MKLYRISCIAACSALLALNVACDADDNDTPMMDDDMVGLEDDGMMEVDFSGTYAQVDYMGRPGINTVLSGSGELKDMHNAAIPSEMQATFQPSFEAQLEAYHDAYAVALGLTAEDVDYEPNILGDILNGPENDGYTENPVSATVLTSVLADDVLEVAPNLPTTYFNPGAGAPAYEGAVGLTGRTLTDDVIDVSLILLFGGGNGARFNGQDGLPLLVSDGVGITATVATEFPYLGNPE
ncbi:DUF4331 family protein [Croceivirga sp. JEA036]|uniref:DUF4331 family protein n=1 Tax=Croceivirga sp. JEA036 TaxID=2721162 RepID=UPI0014395FE6|nr:DUF4331 family protein [Croceivirga sp. JEA036]NJB37744.1 DUF4331 domain-containing protein [Croceivirga sp. JEA036]